MNRLQGEKGKTKQTQRKRGREKAKKEEFTNPDSKGKGQNILEETAKLEPGRTNTWICLRHLAFGPYWGRGGFQLRRSKLVKNPH